MNKPGSLKRAFHPVCILLFSLLLASSGNLLAAKEKTISSLSGSTIKIMPLTSVYSLVAEDQMYSFINSNTNWPCRFGYKQSFSTVNLRFDNTRRNLENTNWTLKITYDVKLFYDPRVTPTPKTFTGQVATINYNTSAAYTDIFSKTYEGALRAELKITNVEWTLGTAAVQSVIPNKYDNDIFFDLTQETERFYNMAWNGSNCTPAALQPPLVTTPVTANPINQTILASSNNQLPIAWSFVEGAESYDVEWLFVDRGASTAAISSFVYDFSRATRVNVTDQHFEIPMAYPNGILVYRVRGVGFSSNPPFTQRVEGPWSANSAITPPANGSSYIKEYQGLDPKYNWQYSAVYAEDGKHKEVISYFDGSLRNRQTVTVLNTDNNAVVAETKYDFQGRPTVQMLPTPLANSGIKYYSNFNPSFNKNSFDKDANYPLTGVSAAVTQAGDKTHDYYGNNTAATGSDAYVPNAQGVPYTQTRYKIDGTGRPIAQSGVGPTHKLGSGHETRYVYGTPAQEELDRLFGNEVGNFLHYKKNGMVDANGQVSVTYLDQEGRTVATALAGSAPANLMDIDFKPAGSTITTDMLTGKNIYSGGNSRISKTTFVAYAPNTTYSFNYTLNTDTACYSYQLSPASEACTLCKDCVFDLEIRVKGEDGTDLPSSMVTVSGTAYYNGAVAATCTVFPSSSAVSAIKCEKIAKATYVVTVVFPNIGSYTIDKVLKINQTQLNSYKNDFLLAMKSPPCGPFTTPTPAEPCNDCNDICSKQYGAYAPNFIPTTDQLGNLISSFPVTATATQPLSRAAAQTQANADYASCLNTCNNIAVLAVPDECELKTRALAADMSPGGQYFDNLQDELYTCSPSNVCSPSYFLTGTPNTYYNASNCIDNWLHTYLDTTAFWTRFDAYLTNPANNSCLPGGIISANRNWTWVRANWQDCFVNFLILYHPEYASHKFYCGSVLLCPIAGNPPPTITTFTTSSSGYTTFSSNAITTKHSAVYDKVFRADLDTPLFFNPLGVSASAASATGYVSNLAQTAPSTSGITRPPQYYDPLFIRECSGSLPIYCSAGGNKSIKSLMSTYLTSFYKANMSPTVSMSLWYVLDDPDNLSGKTAGNTITGSSYIPSGTVIDQATIDFFKSFHTGTSAILANSTKYEVFKNTYLSYKQFLLYGLFQTNYNPTTNTFAGTYTPSSSLVSDAVEKGFTTCTSPVAHARINYPKNAIFDIWLASCPDFTGNTAMQNALNQLTSASLADNCSSGCATSAEAWMTKIRANIAASACSLSVSSPVLATTLANIKQELINICTSSCVNASPSAPLPMGASSTSEALATGRTNFNAVLTYYLGAGTPFASCTNLISNINLVHPAPSYSQGSCTCDNIQSFAFNNGINWNLNDATLTTQIAAAMNNNLDLTYVVTATDVCAWLGNCFQLPSGSNSSCTSLTTTTPLQSVDVFTNPANSWQLLPDALLCTTSNIIEPEDPCGNAQQTADLAYADALRENLITQYKLNAFVSNYINTCLNKLDANEQMTSSYLLNEYYYTLYYYDQAGNLIKTVPPEGVRPLAVSMTAGAGTTTNPYNTKNVALYRQNPVLNPNFVWPFHTLVTNYKYNTLNQLREQVTPDAGKTAFYYDVVGRLVISQNSKQTAYTPKAGYSYTLYDDLSRITEVGELLSSVVMTNVISKSSSKLNTWFTGVSNTDKRQTTRTYYDESPKDNSVEIASLKTKGLYTSGIMGYLRNRVSCVTYREAYNSSAPNSYDNASHYSYDIHGNVKTLYVENTALQGFNYDLNKIDYEYDLISGKVNAVHYNNGKIDQFHHRYDYDADNRITAAYTSRNGLIWEKEAKYFYYKHGPLWRTETGDKQVQATDYAYTLHGWIKGINSSDLTMTNDIGLDGYKTSSSQNLNSVFARDAYGYSLGYFTGDYTAKGGSTGFLASNALIGSMLSTAITDDMYSAKTTIPYANLYNGNIASMVTSIYSGTTASNLVISPLLKSFRYDQLNRIMRVYAHDNFASNSWQSSTNGFTANRYREAFQYDFNGNIKSLKRSTVAGTLFDNLGYGYSSASLSALYTNAPTGVNYLPHNKLGNVTESGTSSATESNDIESQAAGNYSYDGIGNLIADASEEISSIDWTVYGKIKKIIRTGTSTKPDLEYVYDASGNRIMKIVKPHATLGNIATYIKTYYIRDAQGNVMATFDQRDVSGTQRLSLLEQHVFGSSRLGMLSQVAKQLDGNAEIQHQSYFAGGALNGWTGSSATLSVDLTEERLKVSVAANTLYGSALLNLPAPAAGKTYQVTYDLDRGTAGDNTINIVVLDIADGEIFKQMNAQGPGSFIFTAHSSGQTSVKFQNETGSNPAYAFYLDNITIKEVTTTRNLGEKIYEYGNHLANVLTTVSDRKIGVDISSLVPPVISSQDFSSNYSGWVAANSFGTLSLDLGRLKTNTTGTNGGPYKPLPTVSGQVYSLTFDLDMGTTGGSMNAILIQRFGSTYVDTPIPLVNGANTYTFVAADESNFFPRVTTSVASYFFLDNVILTAIGPDGIVDYYKPDIQTSTDYYSFGSPMTARTYPPAGAAGRYRYGFNGKENDRDMSSIGEGLQDYGFRIYHPSLGRFLSVDPLTKSYPWNSTYAFAENDVLRNIDLDGEEKKNYLLVWNQSHTKAYIKYVNTTDFYETSTKWTPTWDNWTKTTTTTVKNPRVDYVVHGTVSVPMSADGIFPDDTRMVTWTFTTAEEMYNKELMRRENADDGWGSPNDWTYASSDQKWEIAGGQLGTYGVEAQGTKSIYSPNVNRAVLLKQFKYQFNISMREDNLLFIKVKVGNNVLEFGGEQTIKDGVLTIEGFDVDGAMVNKLGISKLKDIMSDYGKQNGVTKVITNGAKRTSGANPGKITKLEFEVKE